MTYSKELHDRVRENLHMFDYPRFDDGDIDNLLDEIDRLTAANKDSYTTIEEESHTAENTEYGLVVCQKCKTALPVAMIKYQFKYCPMCGREITDKPTPPTGG